MQSQAESTDIEGDIPWLSVEKIVSFIAVRTVGGYHLLRLDKEFLGYLWESNLDLEAKQALYGKMLQVGQAVYQDNTCWSKVLPTPYDLLKIARNAQTNKHWSIQIPLALLTQALKDATSAARRHRKSRSWRKGIEKSNVFTLWKTVRPSPQVGVLDVIHESVNQIMARWDQNQSERENIEKLLPPLASLQVMAGLPVSLVEPEEDAPRNRNGKVQERRKPKNPAVNPIPHTQRSRPIPPGAEASRYTPPTFNFNAAPLNANPWYAENRRQHGYTLGDFTTVLQHTATPSTLISSQSSTTPHAFPPPTAHYTQQGSSSQHFDYSSSHYSGHYTPVASQSFAPNTYFQSQELFPSNSSPHANQSAAYSNANPPYDLRGSQPRDAVPDSAPLNSSHFLASNPQGYPPNVFTYPPPF